MYLTNASTTCGGACGLYQQVGSGIALYGQSNSTTTSDASVYGASGAALGVQGSSSNNVGVLGTTGSTASDMAGVFGQDAVGAGSNTGFFSAGVRGEGKRVPRPARTSEEHRRPETARPSSRFRKPSGS
jgi:hypothetical protein